MNAQARMSVAEFKRRGLKAHKYSAKATVVNGIRFPSKLEADRYLYWHNQWNIRAIAWFTRQVPFYLPGGIIWRADFVIARKHDEVVRNPYGDTVIVEDCKGYITEAAKIKIRQVEAIYGFHVEIITKGDWR